MICWTTSQDWGQLLGLEEGRNQMSPESLQKAQPYDPFQTSDLQDCERLNLSYLNHQICGIC